MRRSKRHSFIWSFNWRYNRSKERSDMEEIKNIALVAHDHRKKDLIEWVEWNYKVLIKHKLICTGTTGRLIEEAINKKLKDKETIQFEIIKLRSGPLGGDQQLGAMIAEGKVDLVIFLWDPMQPQPHDVDVKALLRIAVVYNIPTACNRATADFMISSPLLNERYEPILTDYSEYIKRAVKL
jgi:methylglyoxal synthase